LQIHQLFETFSDRIRKCHLKTILETGIHNYFGQNIIFVNRDVYHNNSKPRPNSFDIAVRRS